MVNARGSAVVEEVCKIDKSRGFRYNLAKITLMVNARGSAVVEEGCKIDKSRVFRYNLAKIILRLM